MAGQTGSTRTFRSRPARLAWIPALTLALVLPVAPAFAADPPEPGEDFTIAVIPDTQGYTVSATNESKFEDQVDWIVENRDTLNIAWVTQVGDLVESWPNVNHWNRASRYMKVLDDAGVPNSVLPGNHDMNILTGEATTYDTYFPPSRYAAASWNSPDASYGGYLGQNLFGPDPVDRKNKDNFGLLTAGGIDFVLINLEFESPDYTLDWAQKVLDAYPERRAIISTHGFITTGGTRSNTTVRSDQGINSAVQVWNELIYDNCNIFLVLNGHWHDGDEGEANRTDPNACGQPVHQILSNYQSRINGGDGWMRYYTFSPAAGTISAKTYSPTLGRFETDADSEFSLAYDMSPDGVEREVLVRGGGEWAWWYQNTTWPSGWSDPGFSDGAWSRGNAVLGFGSNGRTTNIDVPPPTSNRGRSALFRHTFQLSDPSQWSEISLTTRADDGLVVRVNGVEVGRKNMPTGTITNTTYATAAPSTSAATATPAVFTVPPGVLRSGTNVVAANVHLNYRGTADLSFDVVMSALRQSGEPEPVPPGRPTVTGTAVDSTTARVSWTPGTGPAAVEYRVSRDGGTPVTVAEPTRTYTDSGLPAGSQHDYTVVAVGETGLVSAAGTASVSLPPPVGSTTPVTLVSTGSAWRWLFSSAAWPVGWTGPSFTDGTWQQGAAPLGFGSESIATNIDVPPPTSNRPRTALFRHAFTLDTAAEYSELVLTARADDGAAVWINGTELGRRNLPTGALSTSTYATAAPRTSAAITAPSVYDVPASVLRNGVNVVAVSVHLNYRGTADASMELSLSGTRTTGTPAQVPPGAPAVSAAALGPTSVRIDWTPGSGAAAASYRVFRNGTQIGTTTEPTRSFADSGLAASTTYSYAVVAVGSTGLTSAEGTASATTPAQPPTGGPVVLVPGGATWAWLYSNTAWPANWTSVAFDASTWSSGRAPLGFGFSGVQSNIDVPPPTSNRPRSALFRHGFTVTDPAELSAVSVTTRADDGVVVYLNGVEIGRSNMPTGPITANSYPLSAPRTTAAVANPVTFSIPPSLLTSGSNVLSASVHLNYRGTADVSFDLVLNATRTPAAG
ncbi:hypothetical protein IWX78_000997 [Mycetocola sp. CAN_C7]|uniref:beta galactosidase jelly roll domain-containing protein n=1 Tax=Mycetocola sp. CAN_C7 TaxID=2787724 RepID=UPI0018CAF221